MWGDVGTAGQTPHLGRESSHLRVSQRLGDDRERDREPCDEVHPQPLRGVVGHPGQEGQPPPQGGRGAAAGPRGRVGGPGHGRLHRLPRRHACVGVGGTVRARALKNRATAQPAACSPVPSLPSLPRALPPIPSACPPGALPLQDACRKNRKVFLDEKPKDTHTWGSPGGGASFSLSSPPPHPLGGAERLAGGAGGPEAQVFPLRGLLRWAGGAGLPYEAAQAQPHLWHSHPRGAPRVLVGSGRTSGPSSHPKCTAPSRATPARAPARPEAAGAWEGTRWVGSGGPRGRRPHLRRPRPVWAACPPCPPVDSPKLPPQPANLPRSGTWAEPAPRDPRGGAGLT